jgi:hypothetical protein
MAVATTFWETFFLLLIFVPLAMIWAFALVDIFRRDDLGGAMKALWVAVVFLIPFLGTLIYLVVRPAGPAAAKRATLSDGRTQQLQALADLHDRGKITDEEFAAEKARLLGDPTTTPATA